VRADTLSLDEAASRIRGKVGTEGILWRLSPKIRILLMYII